MLSFFESNWRFVLLVLVTVNSSKLGDSDTVSEVQCFGQSTFWVNVRLELEIALLMLSQSNYTEPKLFLSGQNFVRPKCGETKFKSHCTSLCNEHKWLSKLLRHLSSRWEQLELTRSYPKDEQGPFWLSQTKRCKKQFCFLGNQNTQFKKFSFIAW